jgi:hypothetical protein
MNITLRKAAAIQNEIRSAIKDCTVVGTASINEFMTDSAVVIETARTKAEESISRAKALHRALYDIRAKVSRANCDSGIDDMLTEVAFLDAEIKALESLIKLTTLVSASEIEARLEKFRAVKEDRYAYGTDRTVETGVFDESRIHEFRVELARLKRLRQGFKDKILEANIKSEIALPPEAEFALRFEGIL